MSGKLLHYPVSTLTPSALEFLRRGWCVDEDPWHFRISKFGILDQIYDSGNGPELDDIPEEIWDALNLPAGTRAVIEALWEEDWDNEVEWD